MLGKESWPRKKFSVGPVPSATIGKAVAYGFFGLCREFQALGKA
jgi:hypothetical protein